LVEECNFNEKSLLLYWRYVGTAYLDIDYHNVLWWNGITSYTKKTTQETRFY